MRTSVYKSSVAIRFFPPSFFLVAVAPIFLFSLSEIKNTAERQGLVANSAKIAIVFIHCRFLGATDGYIFFPKTLGRLIPVNVDDQ
jgi:hypothetical protein